MSPFSCDTFVVLPPATKGGSVIFGKNSDRPPSEVQEVVYYPGSKSPPESTKCTYLSVPSAAETYAVMLSKPAWMWGAEMGANQHGVAIGNVAVFTKAQSEDDKEGKLLGMDLVRLGLERSKSADEALLLITGLLESHGQGGLCFEDEDFMKTIYHNSFIIADGCCAWVLETAGKQWAAEKITSGFRNISNQLSIGTQIDAMSEGLKDVAKQQGWWDGEEEFDFAKVYTRSTDFDNDAKFSASNRYNCGKSLLENLCKNNDFSTTSMFEVLRDQDSGICRVGLGLSGAATTGSQVSVLYPTDSGKPSFHWLTATPNPSCSSFKPFFFTPNAVSSPLTISPKIAESLPTEERLPARKHALYRAHEVAVGPLVAPGEEPGNRNNTVQLVQELERQCVAEIEEMTSNYEEKTLGDELGDLFKESCETEMKYYTKFAL